MYLSQKNVENFEKLRKERGLQPNQPYNCDETSLKCKMLPSSTFTSKNEVGVPGYKRSKQRITLLARSNSSGTHKLTLFCIGKSANPREYS